MYGLKQNENLHKDTGQLLKEWQGMDLLILLF